MFIPPAIVPETETKIINKNIIYSDTILNLKELGSNLKITRIYDIEESELNNSLKILFENNKDIIFNTVQYSKENNKLIIYSNKEINTKCWEDSKFKDYEPISSKKYLLDNIKSILEKNKEKDPELINLYDAYILMKEKRDKYDLELKRLKNEADLELRREFNKDTYCCIHGLKNEDNLLISVNRNGYGYNDVYFKESDGDIYISKSEDIFYKDEYLKALSNVLPKLFKFFKDAEKYNNISSYCMETSNSGFYGNVSSETVSLAAKYNDILRIAHHYSNNKYTIDCNSSSIIDLIKDNESKIFERIYIKIEDLPKWLIEDASIYRYNQLVEEERKEEAERKLKEEKEIEEILVLIKKRKKERLKRKIFPFTKN